MAIETNQNPDELNKPTFAGATLNESSAPSGAMDFRQLLGVASPRRIDADVAPYLENVQKVIDASLPGVRYISLNRGYAFIHEGQDGTKNFFTILFVSASDPVSPTFVPASVRLGLLSDEIVDTYGKESAIRICDSRVILAGFTPDMKRSQEMGETIVRAFNASANPTVKDTTIAPFIGTEFVADWRLSEARAEERRLSPHGIEPRMDIGLTLKAKIQNNLGRGLREYDTEYLTFGVIGGYVEFRDLEDVWINNQRVRQYRPVFNITVCNSFIPVEGSAVILIAALATSLFNSCSWATQWRDLTEGKPNPAMLEEDPNNRGRPMVCKDQEELLEFLQKYCTPISIAFQLEDGRDNIPGLYRMLANDMENKSHFASRLSHFFETANDTELANSLITKIFEVRYDGAYGDPNGEMVDSRQIDYLQIAAKNGYGSIDQQSRRVLLNGSDNPADRAGIVQHVTGSFIPLELNTIAVINPGFIRWITDRADARNLRITDPNSRAESRPFGSFLEGFDSSNNIAPLVSNGIINRGLNLGSIWR